MLKKLFKICMISMLLMQYFQPVAVLAERRIVIYENQIGPYYQVDVTGNEIVNTPESEEDNNIIIEETQEMESVENQEESLEIPENTVEPDTEIFHESTIEPENTEVPVETELSTSIEESFEQEEMSETPAKEETVEVTAEPETTELPVPTEEPLLDEKIETTEIPELIEIAPIEFKEISSEFVVETEEGFVFEEAIDEYTSVYASTEEEGLKQLVIGESPINVQVDQSFEPISLALNENTASTYSLRNNTGWSNLNNTIQSTYPVDPAEGITFTVKGKSLTLKSMMNSAGQPVLQDNQIIYPMEGNVNLRYVIQPGVISEDIMIYSPEASSTYSYEVVFESGRIASSENVIAVIDENEELLMYITAPVAYDAAGAETEVALTYEDGIMSVSIDEAWMKSEDRVYPIVIDPEFSNISFNSSMAFDVSVGANQPNNTMGALDMANYNYILPAGLKNHAFLYLGNTSVLSDAHSFYKMKLDHPALSDVLSGKYIKDAYLRLSTGDDGRISKNNTIIAKLVKSNFNILQAKYSAMPQGLEVISETPIEAGNWKSYDIDITDYVRWYYSLGNQNNAVQLQLADQSGSATFHAFEYVCWDQKGWYTPLTIVNYYDGEVSVMTDVNDFTFNLRPFTVSSYEEGILTFGGLGIDGEAPKGSNVNITVSADGETVFSQTIDTIDEFYLYPEYEGIEGAQNYNETKESNYQSTVMSGFEAGKLYTVSLQATDGTMTSTIKTETFQLVEIKNFDVITSVAEYYGVTAEQLVADNNMTDELVTAGNLIIVRNPQNHAGEDYVVDDLSESEQKQIIAALAGRDLTCEYGLIPVNLNTGNFHLESNDFSFNVFADEFTFTRTYNSSAAEVPGDFGYGWSYSGNYAVAKGNGGATVLLEDGTRYYFELDETTGKYTNDLTVKYKLEYDTDHFVLKSQDKTIVFNTKGKVSSIIDHHGNITSYTYNGLQLNAITLPDGKTMAFEYSGGVISKVTMEDGSYVSYSYDADKNLISFTDQTGVTIHYEYNTTHDMTSWYYVADKKIVQNTYNDSHQLTTQIDGTGAETTIQYFEEYTQITDGNNNVQKVYKDGNSWTTKVEYPDGNVETKNYINGLLKSETNENGVFYTYMHDSELYGVLKTSIRRDGFQILYGYDSNVNLTSEIHLDLLGNVILRRTFRYDEHNNLISETDAEGNTTEYTYNEKHQILTKTDPLNRVTRYEYNENWKVSKIINPDGTYKTYTYNDDGYLLSETDEFCKVTTHTLSARNQITKITYPDGGTVEYTHDAAGNVLAETNELGGVTRYEYDTNNNVTKKMVDYRDSVSAAEKVAVTTFEYDENQNLIKKTDANGLVTEYTYDSRNRVLTETVNNILQVTYTYNKYGIATVTNSRGKVKTNTYDFLGRLMQITDFDGLTIKYTYDLLGRVLSETDKHNIVTSYQYNGEGQVTKVTTPRSVTENTYDDAGQLTEKKVTADNIIRTWTYEYDLMGNLIKESDAEGNVTEYVYLTDRLMAKRDQFIGLNETGTSLQCREVIYTYDDKGNVTSETVRKTVLDIANDAVTVESFSDAVTTSWIYDKAGNILTEKDGNNHTTTFNYNVRGDLIKVVEAAESNETAPVTLYEVDAMGQRTKETCPEITHDDNSKVTIVKEYEYNLDGTIKTEKLSGKTIKSYQYDNHKNLTSETVLGVTTSYVYDDFNRMVRKSEGSGLITHYEYDVYSQLKKVSIDDFSTTSDTTDTVLWEAYAYDNYGQVIRESDRYGMSKYYLYNNDGTVQKMKLAPSPATSSEPSFSSVNAAVYENYTYDKLGRLTGKTDQSENEWTYVYDAAGNLIAETINDQEKTYEYDLFNRVIKETNTLDQVTEWEYDGAGNLVAEIDDEGRAHLYFYTPNDLLESEYTAESYANYLSGTETAKRVISYEYYADGSIKKQIDGNGYVEQFKHNIYGNVSESIDKKGYLTVNAYDDNLNLASETTYLNAAKTVFITKSYDYNDLNQMTASTDGENNTTTYMYDIFGNIASIKDAEDYTETYTYNTLNQLTGTKNKLDLETAIEYEAGNLVKKKTAGASVISYTYDSLYRLDTEKDARNNITSYDYDSLGRLSSMTNALNQVTSYTYDGENQLETMTLPNNTVTTNEYDSRGNIIQITVSNATTSRISTVEYDVRGNVVKEVNGAGNVTLYEFDGNNQLTKKSTALNETAVPAMIAEYTYDAYGNVLTEKDGKGNTTTHAYTEAQFKKQTTDPEGNVTTYTYDKAGNLKSVQDAKGYITTYTLDKVGHVEKQTNNANQAEISYEYNGNGQVTKITDLDGKVEEYTYDEYGNLIKHKQKDNTEIIRGYDANFNMTSEAGNSFTYDALNRLSTMTDTSGTTTFTYDMLGNIASATRETEVTSYQYNAYGEKFKVIYPDGSEQTYAYDGAGRISSTTADGITVTYTYDALGNILTETYSNSILVTKTYDATGNLVTQKTEKNGTVLSEYTYGYDGNNSLTSETRILDGVTETLTHEYNERDELVKTTSTKNNVSETIQYTYTVTGNRATVVDGTTTQSFEYNDMNQLVEYSDSDYTYTLSYDDNGNRTQLTRNDGKKIVYTYDDQNRLISTVNQLGVSAEYLYDGLGNRIYEKQSYSGVSVEWNYVNDYTSEYAVVLSEYNGSYNNLYYGNQRISGNGGTYLYDGQGNIIMIMGSGGGIAAGYEYSDYGVMSAEIDGFSNDDTTQVDEWVELWYNKYGYNGEAHTAEGLQYLRSRYYDPVTGSFISADSYRGELNDLLSQNRYTYAHNNPYKYDDPTGHLPASGINKYASNALMDVGSGTSSNPTVKPLPKKTTSSIPTEGYRATNIDEAHARNQQNAFTGSFTLLGSTNKAPVKDTVVPKEETKATGEQESESIGTVTTIVTEHDNTQPNGVETYETQNTETKVIDIKDVTKAIISGAVMAGIGLAVMGLFAAASIAAPIAAVAAAAVSGFSQSFVDANVGALVENKTLEEYGKSQGYATLAEYQNKLFHDAAIGAVVGAALATVLVFGPGLIKNSISKMVGQEAAEHADETLVILSESSDEIGQKGNELSKIVADKGDEVTESLEKGVKSFQGEKSVDEFGRKTVEVNGKTITMDNNTFDPAFVDKQGRTNVQRMEQGLAPIGKDGKSVNIHHIDQTNYGPVIEITATEHQKNYSKLHANRGKLPSQINRNEFNAWRINYWVWRSENLN